MNYFSNICRICMTRDIVLMNIYHTDDDMITYIDKLNTCIPEIFTADNYVPLPDQICELCCKNLKIVFWFRELCLKSNNILRSYHLKLEENYELNKSHEENDNIEIKQEIPNSEYTDNNENITHDSETHIEETEKSFESENYCAVKIKSELIESEEKETDHEEHNKFVDVDEENKNCIETSKVEDTNDKEDIKDSVPIPEVVQEPVAVEAVLKEDLPDQQKKLRHLCSFCGKPFKYRQDMRIHERMHTGYKPYTCQVCSKTFAKSTRLKIHMNTHTREKTYPCTICGKTFMQSSNLGVHMKLHTQTERFACHLCEKTFSQKRHLNQHILFHENERRFTCEICNWNFGMKHHLKRHMMTHSGQRPARKDLPRERERPFSCDQCDWSFMSKEVLKKHLLMHSRENPKLRASLTDAKRRFPCPKCIWSFTKKHHLERHMIKHENRIFPCGICNAEFGKNYELQRHMKTTHSDELVQGNETT